ncbi:MAG: hypothetical protein AMXMBFR13_41970 [Phycisphaerae bacterium]
MAYRLGDVVVCGELLNTRKNCTHGWLGLRGVNRCVHFELTGNPAPDLAGRHIRFKARGYDQTQPVQEDDSAPTQDGHPDESALLDEAACTSDRQQLEAAGLAGFAWQQIGPTGDMTAVRRVRVSDCPPKEFYLRCTLGEPPPTTWKPCLYLEWYSQNGRVVIELVDPEIEYVAGEPADKDLPELDEKAQARSPGDSAVDRNVFEDESSDEDSPWIDDEEDAGDEYKLISDELQRELDRQARETDRAVRDPGDADDIIQHLELMDDLIERGEGEPIGTLFDEPVKLPAPDSLDDEQVEAAFKSLLGQLAMFGIALDMCPHYSPREAYRLLLDHVLLEEHAYPELRGTPWIQHYGTSDHCEACRLEFERDHESRHPPDSPAPSDDADELA